MPDPTARPFILVFATEEASLLAVRADFNFPHHFPEGGAMKCPVFTFLLCLVMLPLTRSEPKRNTPLDLKKLLK